MPRISANEVELNYDLAGSGETLVLVHGGWSDRNNWLTVAAELARSFSVVAYDRRGHGLSQRGVPGIATRSGRRSRRPDRGPRRRAGERRGHLLRRLDRDRPRRSPPGAVSQPDRARAAADLRRGRRSRGPVPARSRAGHGPGGRGAGGARRRARRRRAVRRGGRARPGRLGAAAPAAARDHGRRRPRRSSPSRRTRCGPASSSASSRTSSARCCSPRATRARPGSARSSPSSPTAIDHAEVHTYRGAGHAPHLTNPGDYLATVTDFLSRSPEREIEAAVAAG